MTSRVPKFRLPAAFVSPASLVLIGGVIYYFTRDYTPEEELEATLEKKFPQALRERREKDARMREFVRRVNAGDPREEERMRNLLNAGKGRHYQMRRQHASPKEIEEFGLVPEDSADHEQEGSAAATAAVHATGEDSGAGTSKVGKQGSRDRGGPGRGSEKVGEVSGEPESRDRKPRRWSLW